MVTCPHFSDPYLSYYYGDGYLSSVLESLSHCWAVKHSSFYGPSLSRSSSPRSRPLPPTRTQSRITIAMPLGDSDPPLPGSDPISFLGTGWVGIALGCF